MFSKALTCFLLIPAVFCHEDILHSAKEHSEQLGEAHDFGYDHEVFLGKEQADVFDHLTEDQSKQRLAMMLPKIDMDGNGTITKDELKTHINLIQNRFIESDTERNWNYHPKNENNLLSWSEYQKSSYGDSEENPNYEAIYMEIYEKDKQRFPAADTNHDGFLSKEEFKCFMHPEACDHMKDTTVLSYFTDLDRNKDGSIDENEYFYDVFKTEEALNERDPNGNPPAWLGYERNVFLNTRDRDGDGKLNFYEVRQWIMPDEYDGADVEAMHLVALADSDKDGVLTFDEILAHSNVFVGSQVTNYGAQLKKHDPSEL